MAKEYPRKGAFQPNRNPRSGRACRVCGALGAGKIDIQVSYFRGEDEVVPCCSTCSKTKEAGEILDAQARYQSLRLVLPVSS